MVKEHLSTNRYIDGLVTIIVPIYNVEKYLHAALESILHQTYKKFEVLLIDDGSTDNSSEIAKKAAEENSTFIYYYQHNSGLSASRNKGIKNASGEFILFLDSDDSLEPNALDRLVTIGKETEADLILFGGTKEYYDKNGVIVRTEVCGNHLDGVYKSGNEMYVDLRTKNSYFTGAPFQFVKHKLLDDKHIIFYEGILHEDHLYTFELINSAGKCVAISDSLYHYRFTEGSITKGERYNERFYGFSVTFYQMVKWIKEHSFIRECQEIYKHIDQIWVQAVKYLVFMNASEIRITNKNPFIISTKEYYTTRSIRYYFNIYYPGIRILHYLYYAKRMIKNENL